MSDPWTCHWAAGKSVWQKRTTFLDLTRNLILSLINPSQQVFNWHSSILNNCNNNNVSYLPLGKKRTSPSPNSTFTEGVGTLVGWFIFHLLSILRDTLGGSGDATNFPGLGALHLYSLLGVVCLRLGHSPCMLPSTAEEPLLSAAAPL